MAPDTPETLHGLLFASSARRPGHMALLRSGEEGLTYEQAATAVERCASHLALLEDPVLALVADRSYGLLVSMLGVLAAGKAYCPVEPDFPPTRAAAMVEAASIRHALVPYEQVPQPILAGMQGVEVLAVHASGLVETEVGAPVEASAEAVPSVVPDSSTAYVLFTSGSTGKPKGCMVPHRGSCKYAKSVVKACGLTEDMVYLLKTPYVFDVSVQDIFTAFAAGGTLAIAEPGAHRDAGAVCEIIASQGVHVACFVPTLLVEFANFLAQNPGEAVAMRATLKRVLTIGEALMSATCRQMFQLVPGLEIHNLYGPTEASVGVSHQAVTAATLGPSSVVPIGSPFGYVVFRVFDAARYEDCEIKAEMLVEVPEGEIGELFIGGDCLAQGYIHNAEKTKAAFFDFPEVLARPAGAASTFSLYKTGDLVRQRLDGTFEYLGRNDFQVKIGGVRIECEEVSAVLKTHAAVDDALVIPFEGPFGKALAAYLVASNDANWTAILADHGHGSAAKADKASEEEARAASENVSKWGAVYDEMYRETGASISQQDPTLNWSGYTDTYSRRPHIEPVIREWVEWSCEQVSRHKDMFVANRASGRRSCVTELGCGNGMLLFRLAPLLGSAAHGRYVGTDISTTALEYVQIMRRRTEYADLGIETAQLAAHEISAACGWRENDVVLCNGVTMYFPSTDYLLESMEISASTTRPGGRVIFGDVQSKRHLLPFRAHVETYHALRRPDATAAAVLRAAKQTAAHEELSYFDDALFQRLDRLRTSRFSGRLARMELRVKRGWWHSEFSRFRYDVELVMAREGELVVAEPEPCFLHLSYGSLCSELGLAPPGGEELADPRLVELLPSWVAQRLAEAAEGVDGLVVEVPNARTLQAVRLLEWLETAASEGVMLSELPAMLHPTDASSGSPAESAKLGVEPEFLFTMPMPNGWVQRVVWAEDPGMLRLVLLRAAAAEQPWLAAACSAPWEDLPSDLAAFKNRAEDIDQAGIDPIKACNDAFKAWTSHTSLLPAMRPVVYIPLDTFPKNAAGKVDRAALPDARKILEQVSDAAAIAYEPPVTEDEVTMVGIWEKVLKGVQVGVNTPFIAYGGHSLTAIQLCSRVLAEFGQRPDLVFLTSEDCTVRALLRKIRSGDGEEPSADGEAVGASCVVRLSPPERRGVPLLIFGMAGSSVATYAAVAEQVTHVQVYAVELPGRGRRAGEAAETNFQALFRRLEPDVMAWSEQQRRFFAWGDSLGAIIAYEFARRWQEATSTSLMGLVVSGNAGPTEASAERGLGESAFQHLGLSVESCAEMSQEDWKRFLLASSGSGGAEDMAKLLQDPDLAEAAIGPLRADCLAYESYRLDKAARIHAPIVTMRGEHDHITAPEAVRSWKRVAGGRVDHKEFPRAGHMLAKECPLLLAGYLDNFLLPDFEDELRAYQTYRAAYRFLRHTSIAKGGQKKMAKEFELPTVAFRRQSSPVLGTHQVPKDFQPEVSLARAIGHSETITPQSIRVKLMRFGNWAWRVGSTEGNPMRSP